MTTRPTIVCLSANPALDRRLRLPTLSLGEVNRARTAEVFPGGKAAHVAMAVRALGAKAVWIGFLGGAIGEECAAGLSGFGIEVVRVRTSAATRANLEVIEDSGRITEVLEPGGQPDADERTQMLQLCAESLRGKWHGASLVISGSLPGGAPPEFYASVIESARAAGSQVFLDTSGEALQAALGERPDFVKPNRTETETLLRRPLRNTQDVVAAGRELIERGAQSVAITLGAEGLVWIESKDGPVWLAQPPNLRPISTVGCGDTTLGGFACAQAQGLRGEAATRLATACGAANCLAAFEGGISQAEVQSLIPQIQIQQLA